MDMESQDAIYDASVDLTRRCAGTGYPFINKNGEWDYIEIVDDCEEVVGVTAGSGKDVRGVKVHYAPSKNSIHSVPYRKREKR